MSTKTARVPVKTIQPSGNRLFVSVLPNEDTSPGGIILPAQAQANKETRRATVIEVGPGMYTQDGKRIAMPFKPGDVILFPKYAGNEVQFGTKSYLIVTEPDVLGTETTK